MIYQNNGVIFEKIMGIYEKRIKFLSGVLKAYIRDVKKATLVSYLVMGVLQGMEHYKMMEENSMENEKAYQIMKNFLKSALGENTEEEK